MQQKFLEKTLGQQIADMAAKYPDDNMIDYTDRDYSRTWKEFNDECETIARGFMALGLKKGSHISIWGTNVPAANLFRQCKNGRYSCYRQHQL